MGPKDEPVKVRLFGALLLAGVSLGAELSWSQNSFDDPESQEASSDNTGGQANGGDGNVAGKKSKKKSGSNANEQGENWNNLGDQGGQGPNAMNQGLNAPQNGTEVNSSNGLLNIANGEGANSLPLNQGNAFLNQGGGANGQALQESQGNLLPNIQNTPPANTGQGTLNPEIPMPLDPAMDLPPEPVPSPSPTVDTASPPSEPPLDGEPAPTPSPGSASAEGPIIQGPARPDLEPRSATLHWVGYDYAERQGVVRIQMVTRGTPKFSLFQERNKAGQAELVVRFFNTSLRTKLRRDINASEFRSPVAYVRMRFDDADMTTDVILTMRDRVTPRLFSRYGNVMLTFAIPDHYFGNPLVGQEPVAQAEIFPNSHVLPEIVPGSSEPEAIKVARAYVPTPGQEAFKEAPPGGGEPVVPAPVAPAPTNTAPLGEPLPPLSVENSAPLNGAVASNLAPNGATNLTTSGEAALGNGQGNGTGIQGENVATSSDEELTFGNAGMDAQGQSQGQGQNQTNQNQEESEEEKAEETLDGDSLENLDNGQGDSRNDVDKFDVRVRSPRGETLSPFPSPSPALVVRSFSLLAVAQDQFNNANLANTQQGKQQNQQQGNNSNQQNNSNLSNAQGNSQGQGQGNFGLSNNGNTGEQGASQGAGGNFNAPPANLENPPMGANVPINNGFGGGNGGGGNAALVNTPTNAAPLNGAPSNTPPPTSVDGAMDAATADGVRPGEPPIVGQPDLAGVEQDGQAIEEVPAASGGGRPIKLDFRGAPLSEVVRVLADESGVNFVMPPEVGKVPVYVNLAGVPFNDALRAVIDSNGLGMVDVAPNIIRIDTLKKLNEDRIEQEKGKVIELKAKPTKVLVHRLNYAKADKAAPLLLQMLNANGMAAAAAPGPAPLLGGGGGGNAQPAVPIAVTAEERTNSVIVRAPQGELAMVKALLERIDLEIPQVKIASRIVEVLKNGSNVMGISWGGPFNLDQGRGLGFGTLVFPNSAVSRYSVDAGGTNDKIGNFQTRIGSLNNMMAFDLALSLEETRGTGEVLQSSNLIVQDNEKATIVDGRSDFFPPPAGVAVAAGQGGAAAGERINYNLTMEVQPHITAEGSVQLEIDIKSDSPGPNASAQARASTINRAIKTKMIRRSGETAVIGGVYTTAKDEKKSGIPFLQSIPIIGALFRSTEGTESKKELLVLVTPTILAGMRGGAGGASGNGESAAGASFTGATNAVNFAAASGTNSGNGGGTVGSLQNEGLGQGQNAGNDNSNAPNNGGFANQGGFNNQSAQGQNGANNQGNNSNVQQGNQEGDFNE